MAIAGVVVVLIVVAYSKKVSKNLKSCIMKFHSAQTMKILRGYGSDQRLAVTNGDHKITQSQIVKILSGGGRTKRYFAVIVVDSVEKWLFMVVSDGGGVVLVCRCSGWWWFMGFTVVDKDDGGW